MGIEERTEYAKTRLEHAEQCLKTARENVKGNDYKAAANRSYYAIFHAMRAATALIEDGERSKHQGVSSVFRKEYIKTGMLPENLSDTITSAFEVRNECDYDDFYVISKDEVDAQIQRAQDFIETIEQFLKLQGVL